MDSILQVCEQAKDWLRPHMFFIATALVTCTLVACSDIISKHLRILTSKWPKVFRTLIFILVTAFGYGSAIVYLTPVISKILLTVRLNISKCLLDELKFSKFSSNDKVNLIFLS